MRADEKISVIIMAFNERESLASVCEELAGQAESLGQPYEILIIDDGSNDGTGPLADALAEKLPPVRVIHHDVNQGLGGVYRTGAYEAVGDWVTFFPADGQFPAKTLEDFVRAADAVDLVLGHLDRPVPSIFGQLLSSIEKLLYRLLVGRMPRFQGVLMFRRRILDDLPLRATGRGWAGLLEMLISALRKGYRYTSVKTEVLPRRSGHSKVRNLRTIWANTRQLLHLAYKSRI